MQCLFSSSEKSLNKGETIVNMIILFENGCIGNAYMDICYNGPQKHTVEFHGEDGIIILQNNSSNFVDNFELIFKNLKRTKRIKPEEEPNLSYNELEDSRVKIIKPLAERFIKWCSTGVAAKPDFQDGLRVQKLIEIARVSDSKFHKYK